MTNNKEPQELRNPRNSGTQELRNSGTQELRNSGTQELRNSGTQLQTTKCHQ